MAIYSVSLIIILFYALAQLNLLVNYLKAQKKKDDGPKFDLNNPDEVPYVTIQLPLYNELYVGQLKMQKTRMTEGYHNWHCEHSKHIKDRLTLLAFMVYLNDVDEGGETEFLYQSKRIKPVRNTFVVWPAGFTHTHRGNPPLSNVKYVITGWINCI